jgi:hypothetical protein
MNIESNCHHFYKVIESNMEKSNLNKFCIGLVFRQHQNKIGLFLLFLEGEIDNSIKTVIEVDLAKKWL